VLDLLLFGLPKRIKRFQLKTHCKMNHLLRVFSAYEAVMTSPNVRSSWVLARLCSKKIGDEGSLELKQDVIRGAEEFKTVPGIDFPESSLSLRRGILSVDLHTMPSSSLMKPRSRRS
jgi:hypothetical protein